MDCFTACFLSTESVAVWDKVIPDVHSIAFLRRCRRWFNVCSTSARVPAPCSFSIMYFCTRSENDVPDRRSGVFSMQLSSYTGLLRSRTHRRVRRPRRRHTHFALRDFRRNPTVNHAPTDGRLFSLTLYHDMTIKNRKILSNHNILWCDRQAAPGCRDGSCPSGLFRPESQE